MFSKMITTDKFFAKTALNQDYMQKVSEYLEILLNCLKRMSERYEPCRRGILEFYQVQEPCMKLQQCILDLLTYIDIKTRAYENKKLVKKELEDQIVFDQKINAQMDKIDTLKMFQSTVQFIDFHEQLQLKKQQNLEVLSH